MKPTTATIVKKEIPLVETVNLDSDSDDSVVHVPYVKPAPPTISIDDESDGEVESRNNSSEPHNETVGPPKGSLQSESLTSDSGTTEKPKKQKNKNKKNKNNDANQNKRGQQINANLAVPATTAVGIGNTPKRDKASKKRNKSKVKDTTSPTKKAKKTKITGENPALVLLVASTASHSEIRVGNSESSIRVNYSNAGSANDASKTVLGSNNPCTMSEDVASTVTTSSETSTVGHDSTSETTPGVNVGSQDSGKKKGAKRKRKKDLDDAAVSAAKEEFTSFLKTLNLTSNIGMNDKDMQMIAALSPADLTGLKPTVAVTTKSRTKSCSVSETSSVTVEVIAPPPVDSEESSEVIEVQFQQTSIAAEHNILPKSCGATSTVTVPIEPPPKLATPSPLAFVSIVDETTPKRGKKQAETTGTKTPELQNILRNNKLGPSRDPVQVTIDDDDSEGETFTTQELNQVKSNIRLNISGVQKELTLFDLSSSFSPDKHLNHQKPANLSNTMLQKYGIAPEVDSPAELRTPSSEPPFSANLDEPLESDNRSSGSYKRKHKSSGSEGSPLNISHENPLNTKKRKTLETDSEGAKESAPVPQPSVSRQVDQSPTLQCTDKTVSNRLATKSNSRSLGHTGGNGSWFPSSWTSEMIEFYGKINQNNFEVDDVLRKQSDSPRLWRIPVDSQPQRRRGKQFKCTNCNQFGYHTPNRCPEPRRVPKCVMCGTPGHTTSCIYTNNNNSSKNAQRFAITKCLKALCLNCGRRFHNQNGHRFVQACDYCYKSTSKCQCCGVDGHKEADCPDSWRRFHSTLTDYDDTDLRQMVKSGEFSDELQKTTYRRRYDQYCSNCARKGHNYYHCDQRKDHNAVFIPVTPYIAQELPIVISPTIAQDSGTTATANSSSATGVGLPDASSLTVAPSSIVDSPVPVQNKIKEPVKTISNVVDGNKSLGSKESENIIIDKGAVEITESFISDGQKSASDKQEITFVWNKHDDSDIEILDVIEKPEPTTKPDVVKKKKVKKKKNKDSKESSSLVVQCRNFPDCRNTLSIQTLCFKVKISNSEHHKALLKLNEKHGIVEKLQQLYKKSFDVSISLLKGIGEFHLSGRQFYRARDRISRLVKDINTRTEVSQLLPELFPPTDKSTSEVIPSPAAGKKTPAKSKVVNSKVKPAQQQLETPAKPAATTASLGNTPRRKSVTPTSKSTPAPSSTPEIASTKVSELNSVCSANEDVISLNSAAPSQSTTSKSDLADPLLPDVVVDTPVTRYEFDRKIRKIMCQSAKIAQQATPDTSEVATESEQRPTESSSLSAVRLDSDNYSPSPKDIHRTDRVPEVSTVIPIPNLLPNPLAMGFHLHPNLYAEPNAAHDVDERQLPAKELQTTNLVSPNSPFAFNPLMAFYPYNPNAISFPYTLPNQFESKIFTNDILAKSVVENDSSGFIIFPDVGSNPEPKI